MDGHSFASASMAREVQGKFQEELRVRFEELQNFIVYRHQVDMKLLFHLSLDDDRRPTSPLRPAPCSRPLPGMTESAGAAGEYAGKDVEQQSRESLASTPRSRLRENTSIANPPKLSAATDTVNRGWHEESDSEYSGLHTVRASTMSDGDFLVDSFASEDDDLQGSRTFPRESMKLAEKPKVQSFKKGTGKEMLASLATRPLDASSDAAAASLLHVPTKMQDFSFPPVSASCRSSASVGVLNSRGSADFLDEASASLRGSTWGAQSNSTSAFRAISFKGSIASMRGRKNSCVLLPVWDINIDRMTSGGSYGSMLSCTRTDAFNMQWSASLDSNEATILRHFTWLVMQPNSVKRIVMDILAMLFVFCDAIMIPLQLFLIPETAIVSTVFWMARIFWTIDSMTMFFAGYISHTGDIEMRPVRTVWHYIYTWFIPDVLWLILDWAEVLVFAFVSDEHCALDIVRYLRYLRYLRICRILQLFEMVKHWGERFRSEKAILLVNLTTNFTAILGVAHLVACLWYAVGRSSRSSGKSWVIWIGSDDIFELYTLSLHWSMAHFAGSDFEVLPQSNGERSFAIVIVLFCFVVSACFVSSITSYLTRLQILTSTGAYQLATLRRFLEDKEISRQLSVRVQRNAQHALMEKQRNTPESEVELLRLISEPLLIELHFEEYVPILRWHSFFDLYQDKNPGCMRRLCHTGVSLKKVYVGDIIFSHGERPVTPMMYFLISGLSEYEQDGSKKAKVQAERWIAEPVLWVHWTHCGLLRAISESRLLALSAEAFQSITSQFKVSWFHPAYYAHEYLDHLQEAQDANQSSDLDSPDLPFRLTRKAYKQQFESQRGSTRSMQSMVVPFAGSNPDMNDNGTWTRFSLIKRRLSLALSRSSTASNIRFSTGSALSTGKKSTTGTTRKTSDFKPNVNAIMEAPFGESEAASEDSLIGDSARGSVATDAEQGSPKRLDGPLESEEVEAGMAKPSQHLQDLM